MSPNLLEFTPEDQPSRRLTAKDLATWDTGVTKDDRLAFGYRDLQGNLVAQKLKTRDKVFSFVGDTKNVVFFGAHKWPTGGKRVTITEGELDCISWSAIERHQWPVISLAHGAKNAPDQCKKHLSYLQQWQEVVLMFDSDSHGIQAAQEVAEVLMAAGVTCRIARLPQDIKDPSEALQQHRTADIKRAYFEAKEYRPEGVMSFGELEDTMRDFKVPEGFPWFHSGLQAATRGRRPGEISLITAPPKVGKTEFTRAQILFDAKRGTKVGLVRLEEAGWRSFLGDVGMAMGQRFHVEGINPIGTPEYEETARVLRETLFYYNHRGSLAADSLFSKMNYMAVAAGCEILLLDHITIAVSGLEVADERKALDVFLTRLVELAQKTRAHIMAICHVKKGVERDEEGWDTLGFESFRGTGGFAQLTDTMLGIESYHGDDVSKRDQRRLRVIADRWLNDTGIKGYLQYDRETGVLREGDELEGVF